MKIATSAKEMVNEIVKRHYEPYVEVGMHTPEFIENRILEAVMAARMEGFNEGVDAYALKLESMGYMRTSEVAAEIKKETP